MRAEGPLCGVRVVYVSAPGPLALATMLLADLGADVIRVDRTSTEEMLGLSPADDPRSRGQRAAGIDLKNPDGLAVLHRLLGPADVFLEGMRPGVAERLGLGPDQVRDTNQRLIYGRMTGWGQCGPLANRAGHDINYIALAGALHPMGSAEGPPTVPLNLLADFGGGSTYLVIGVLAALLRRARTGHGEVIDAAMVDGVASLTAMFHGMLGTGLWSDERGTNVLDGAAPFYRTYSTGDGQYIAVGALEPKFYRTLITNLGLDPDDWPQHDRTQWDRQAAAMAAIFAQRTRDDWTALFADQDACVTPVLTMTEASYSPLLAHRQTFMEVDGLRQPAPAPRLATERICPVRPGHRVGRCGHTDEVLTEIGYGAPELAVLRSSGAIR